MTLNRIHTVKWTLNQNCFTRWLSTFWTSLHELLVQIKQVKNNPQNRQKDTFSSVPQLSYTLLAYQIWKIWQATFVSPCRFVVEKKTMSCWRLKHMRIEPRPISEHPARFTWNSGNKGFLWYNVMTYNVYDMRWWYNLSYLSRHLTSVYHWGVMWICEWELQAVCHHPYRSPSFWFLT